MKILLINPPFNRLKGLKLSCYPLGLGYLGASLKEAGFEVKLYQAENPQEKLVRPLLSNKNQLLLDMYQNYQDALNDTEHFVWDEIAGVIESEKPEVVGISCMTPHFASALQVARITKEVFTDSKVILGGQHPTLLPDKVIINKNIDFVIRGEGERTIVELCRVLAQNDDHFERIDGLSFKTKNGMVHHNKNRALIQNLDEFVFPLRTDLVFPKAFLPPDLGTVITSRGCPFECTFCSAKSMWTRMVRFRTIENIIKELRQLVDNHNLKEMFFWDDTLTANRKHITGLCKKIIDEKLGINWGCNTRIDLIDDELLELMKEAGCSRIDFGIESGSEPILQQIKKGINLKQINRGLRLINDKNIFPTAFFMIGLPDETEEDIQKTFQLMQNIDATVNCSIFTPYPGTELFKQMEHLKMVPANMDWSEISHHSPNNYFSRYIDKKRYLELMEMGAKIVDEHNNHFRFKYKYLKNNLGFYFKNPRFLIYKVRKYIF